MNIKYLIIIIISLFWIKNLTADVDLIVDLSGTWHFRTGDHITWRNVQYNHDHWDTIQVPATWESQDYVHDGYAWYRKAFTLPDEYVGQSLYLIAGKIDDADQTFINGHMIGYTGTFPPNPSSEWNTLRVYEIPEDLLKEENIIAIRVYDMGQEGGIHEGPIGIAREFDKMALLNVRREPYQSFYYLTASNGYGAAVINTQSGLIEHFFESIYKMQDPETETRDLLGNVDARFTIDGTEYSLRNTQPESGYYVEQSGIIRLTYDNGLLLTIFSPLSVDLPVIIVNAHADTGHQLDSFSLEYDYPEAVADLQWAVYDYEQEDQLLESRTIIYVHDSKVQDLEDVIIEDDIVDTELQLWEKLHEQVAIPEELTYSEQRLYKQSISVLTMGQSRETGRANGQIIASLPPGMWNITWVRDGAYAIAAMAQAGLHKQARKGLSFYLNADVGYYKEYVHTDGIDYGIGNPYQISVCRYFGDGTEESDSNGDGPNIELDGFGLFLWALHEYVKASNDTEFLEKHWDTIQSKIADVIVTSRDETGLIRADSGPWERHLPGKRFAYTSIVNWYGLHAVADLAGQLEKFSEAAHYREVADSLQEAILEHLIDDNNVIKSNFETGNPGEYHYYDASVVEAINFGLIEPDSEIATSTIDTLRSVLTMEHRPYGYHRVNNGDWYDHQEWIFINLRMVAALSKMNQRNDAEDLLRWVVEQSAHNYYLIAELYDEYSAAYEGAVPMVGFGAGAYILALYEIQNNK